MTSISFLLFTYNHEAFVEAALISALRQDVAYSELIIVDDASTDRTKTIIQEVLARESACRVKVTTLFHDRNLGVLAAVNAAMAVATSEIFVMMAGDDVSMPDRIRRTTEIFKHNPSVQLAYGEVERIDADGQVLRPVPTDGMPRRFAYSFLNLKRIYGGAMPCGASAAYRRRLYDVFGPMRPGSHGEDNCYWVRALLLGEIHHDPACFIQWRQHSANLSNFLPGSGEDWRRRHLDWMAKHAMMSPQWLADIAKAKELGLISARLAFLVRYAARREDATWALEHSSLRQAPWGSWMRSAWALIRVGRFSTTLRMLKLRLSRSRREKRWQLLAKLKSNSAV